MTDLYHDKTRGSKDMQHLLIGFVAGILWAVSGVALDYAVSDSDDPPNPFWAVFFGLPFAVVFIIAGFAGWLWCVVTDAKFERDGERMFDD